MVREKNIPLRDVWIDFKLGGGGKIHRGILVPKDRHEDKNRVSLCPGTRINKWLVFAIRIHRTKDGTKRTVNGVSSFSTMDVEKGGETLEIQG